MSSTLKIKHKANCLVKQLNYVFRLAGEKMLVDMIALDEWINQAYEKARMFNK